MNLPKEKLLSASDLSGFENPKGLWFPDNYFTSVFNSQIHAGLLVRTRACNWLSMA